MTNIRVRQRLSYAERDAVWIDTSSHCCYRFHEGKWQASKNVYYGTDTGWYGCMFEPYSSGGRSAFVECKPNQDFDDPDFRRLIDTHHSDVSFRKQGAAEERKRIWDGLATLTAARLTNFPGVEGEGPIDTFRAWDVRRLVDSALCAELD